MLFTHSENKSLKQKFFLQTLFIGFVIIAIAIYFYASTINEKENVFKEVQFIDAQLEKINQFKQKRIILQQSILNFLIDPIYHNQENVIYSIVDEMIQIIEEFKQNEVTKHSHDLETDVLINKLKRFKSILEELITIRMNVELQFPAMSLSAIEMTGIDNKFNSNSMIMIDEIESGSLIPKQKNIYPLLLKTRTAWVSLVSQMRVYLANRLASFSTELLESQANSALSISEVLIENLDQLEQYYLEEEDSFEGLDALQKMHESVYTWLDIFSEMRIQSESRQWRQDWNFLDKNIIPEENSIFQSLSMVEKKLREEERFANSTLNRSIDKAFIFIAIVIIVGIAFIYIVLFSINKMVFTPIQAVSNALQAKAFGKEIPAFEIKPSKETQILIEAFEEMDHQVSQRQETLEIQAEHLKEYQTELEEMVESRTIELKKTNESLTETLDELHRTQTQLIENEKMAALGGLVSGVAHEINTPIGVCVTASSTLQDTSKALKKMLDSGTIKKSSLVDFVDKTETGSKLLLTNLVRASDLINNFKQVAVDQSVDETRHFELNHYIHEVLTSLQPKWKATKVIVDFDAGNKIEVTTYPGAIAQVLTNLIINSLIHGFDEGQKPGKIVISTEQFDHKVNLRYRDNGNGMPEEVLGKIFNPFFTTRRGSGGTGLGMHIVYNLVTQKLRGTINCQSQLNSGCEVLIQLPLDIS